MPIRFNRALVKRRKDVERDDGFTLIELLVVVIIIGILAAIAVPIYLGVQQGSKDGGVKTDAGNAKIAIIAYYTDNKVWPSAAAVAAGTGLTGYGWTQGSTTASIAYTSVPAAGATTFCIVATANSGSPASTFYTGSSSGVVKATAVPANC